MNHYYWDIDGWITQPQLHLYNEMVKNAKDGAHFVEIGLWKGKSTSYLAVEIINSNKKIKLDAIDTFLGSEEHKDRTEILNGDLYETYKKNIERVKHQVNTIVGDSSRMAENYADNSLDFVFLDGDHSYEGVKRDLLAWLPKLKSGGIMAGDDYSSSDFPGVLQAVGEILPEVEVFDRVWIYKNPKVIEHNLPFQLDEHLQQYNNYSTEIDGAYIITIIGNETSEKCAERCADSLQKLGMNYNIWPAFDGTDKKTIKTPEHLRGQQWLSLLKIQDHLLSASEIGCLLSHISLWMHCIAINKPIVILEHDTIMLKKYTHMPGYCCIEYLGHLWWAMEYMKINNLSSFDELQENLKTNSSKLMGEYPLVNMTNENYLYPMGNHAYSIDPFVAKKLIAKIILEGITVCNDTFMNAHEFTIFSRELFATQDELALERSTIRPEVMSMKEHKDLFFDHRKPTTFIPGVSRKVEHKESMNHPAWRHINEKH